MADKARTPLEIAMESPDPAIRDMAIRRMGVDKEMEALRRFAEDADAFFGTYVAILQKPSNGKATALTTGGTTAGLAKDKTMTTTIAFRKSTAATADSVRRFDEAVTDILNKRGVPLTCELIYQDLKSHYPDLNGARNSASMSHRIKRRPGLFVKVDKGRWWVAGKPVPRSMTGEEHVS